MMSKRTKKDSSEERVTAKSKPMMNLVSRCSERISDVLASVASESPVKTRYESQLPLSSWNEQHQRTGRLVLDAYSSNFSEWNADKNWSSQEWKSDEVMEVRTVRLVNEQPPGLFAQHRDRFNVDDDDMDSDTVAESDMSWKSRSFAHRVYDRVRKMLDQSSKDATQDSNKHSSSTLQSICTHGKELPRHFSLHQQEKISQWNRFLTYLKSWCPNNQMRSMEVLQLTGMIFSRKLFFDWWWRSHQSLAREDLRILADSVLYLGKMNENPQSNTIWEDKLTWFKSSSQYRALDTIDGETNGIRVEYFPEFTTLQLVREVQEFLTKMSEEPEDLTSWIIFMSMFNDISWGSKDNEQKCELISRIVSFLCEKILPGRWSLLGPGSEKKWFLLMKANHKENGTESQNWWWSNFSESGHPVFLATIPLSRGTLKRKGGGKVINKLLRWWGNDWNCFSHNYFC